ncbi:MAG: hypothetical protein Q8O17_02940 [Candidatus Methanoperedens sp.]|nr:hypothetical protein [Candidatus Methanoperedens sp.]
MDEQTEKDITEVVNLYRLIKMTLQDATDLLLLIGSVGVIGIMFYIVKEFGDILIKLKLSEILVMFLSLVLLAGGTIWVILTAIKVRKNIGKHNR